MPNWSLLEHAYGNAADIPALLVMLSPDPHAPVWEALWSRVCHQGSVYSASLPVLPYLLQSASEWPASRRAMPLSLAGAIVASEESAEAQHLAAYRAIIVSLHNLAIATLSATNIEQT